MRIYCKTEQHDIGGPGSFYLARSEKLLPKLIDEYKGKVQLIYLDPPFGTGDSFQRRSDKDEESRIPLFRDDMPEAEYLKWMRTILTGCHTLLSPTGSLYLHIDWRMNAKLRLMLDDIFGEDNFFVELQDHGMRVEPEVNRALRQIANELSLPMVVTNDVHYMRKEDAYMQEVLMCIQTNHTVDDPDRMRFETEEFYLKSGDEMAALFPDDAEAIANTVRIAERCNVEIEFGVTKLPHFEVPEGYDSWTYLNKLCRDGMEKRYPGVFDEKNTSADYSGVSAADLRARLEYELNTIRQMGYVDYFLIVWDYINLWGSLTSTPSATTCSLSASSILSVCPCPISTWTSGSSAGARSSTMSRKNTAKTG